MSTVSQTIRASIVGASGYSGIELLKILRRHPHVRIDSICAATSAGGALDEIHPWFAGQEQRVFAPYTAEAVGTSDVVFLALPSGEAMAIAPELVDRGQRVIDLGGDFRLTDHHEYEQFYGRPHLAAGYLAGAVYALPEWNRGAIATASLLANPGCYPTSAILPLAPLLKEGVIEPESIAISSMSGVSGAGRKGGVELSFCEVNDTMKAYRVGDHQHIPEIRLALESVAGCSVGFTFVPHLVPITRGIYTTTVATLAPGMTEADVRTTLADVYADAPFVRIASDRMPEVRDVVGTNFIDIGLRVVEGNRLILISTLDNLIKGAAGQAVQNMNIVFGGIETEGLL